MFNNFIKKIQQKSNQIKSQKIDLIRFRFNLKWKLNQTEPHMFLKFDSDDFLIKNQTKLSCEHPYYFHKKQTKYQK